MNLGTDFVFMVIGDRCYGKATTETEAKKNCKSQATVARLNDYQVYLVPPDTTLDGVGNFQWNPETNKVALKSPILIKTVVGTSEVPPKLEKKRR